MAQRSRANDVARKTNRCLKINRHFLLKWITRLGLGSTICFAMYLYRTLEDIMLLSGNNEVEKNIGNCPPNYSLVRDNVLPDEVTHANRKIPSVIHFFVRSKCLPVELTDHMHHWTSLTNYTILFHDEEEIHNHLSKERSDLPFLPDAFRCAVKHEAILDLARTVFLYDFGGYSVDIDHIPGPEFLHGGHFMHSPHQYGAQRKHQDFYGWENYEFLIEEDQAKSPYPHFLASEPRHMVTHITMMISIGFQSLQFTNASVTRVYDQIGVYWQLCNYLKMFNGEDHNETVTKKWYGKFGDKAIRIGIIRESRMVGDLFVKLNLTNAAKESVRLREIPPGHCSVDLLNDSYRVDVKSLLNITGKYGDEDTGVSCPDGQVYVSNTFRPESIVPGRKIPKIIHMTSKTKCFTKAFADNIHRWRFEGYSLLIHDDPAVERLLNKHWPEFPLLKNVRSCIFYGAALADIWRYLVIWEYGGVYTDVDDAPGQLDVNGTMIKDEDDAYFEVERSGLPSQYYFAASPHHPVSYLLLSSAISNLIAYTQSLPIRGKRIPYITGPGALDPALRWFIGDNAFNPFPNKGVYTGTSNRTITIVGSRISAEEGIYHRREKAVTTEERLKQMAQMNMPHYNSASHKAAFPRDHTCAKELYNQTRHSENDV